MSDDEERLSPGTLAYLVSKVEDRTIDPDEARQLLAEFVACARTHEAIPERLVEYLRDAFSAYLTECRNRHDIAPPEHLGRALGLVRATAGNPGTDERKSLRIAVSIMRVRLAGDTAESAIAYAMDRWQCGRTTATDAWRERKRDALTEIRVERAGARQEWTRNELQRLHHIFQNDRDAIPETLRLPAD